jgi:hypothetical protein
MTHARLIILAGALTLAPVARAQEPAAPASAKPDLSVPASSPSAEGVPLVKLQAPDAIARPGDRPAPPRNYWIPALEITAWNIFQNRWSYYTGDKAVYDVNLTTWKHNLTEPWWWDGDQFSTNGFAHPYMGAIYYNLARSNGLGFWESFGYAFGGSLMWEEFGETEHPAVNDQITTPWAGTILGEILWRLSNRILDAGGEHPSMWHEFGALALNPAGGFNRIIYGNKYRPNDINLEPFHGEFRLYAGVLSEQKDNGVWQDPGLPVGVSAHLVNGVPGSDFVVRRPFDYYDANFNLTINKNTLQAKGFMTFMLRGAVLSWMYGEAPSRGLHGLYFDYDYIAPAIFRVESANLAYGTTGQVDWGTWALQGHAALGLGFGAAGSASDAETKDFRDYHFGGQAVAMAEGTLYYKDDLRLAVRVREYVTGEKITDQQNTYEDITYATAGLTWRIAGRHAVGVEGTSARRNAHYPDLPSDIKSKVSTLTVSYQMLGDFGLGRGH